ncbi:MAG: hypothetical protein ACNS63_13305 [Candidatus Nitrospinota bacterium M3_3B_026]
MKDFSTRFSVALGIFAFGVAGFASMTAGAGSGVSALRALAAGAVFFVFGKLLAVILFDGPVEIPKPPKPPPGGEKKR